jgi:hypothetical protein
LYSALPDLPPSFHHQRGVSPMRNLNSAIRMTSTMMATDHPMSNRLLRAATGPISRGPTHGRMDAGVHEADKKT